MTSFADADIPFGHNLTAMAETAGPGKNMEDVSIEVKQRLDEQKVPISYWQYVSLFLSRFPTIFMCLHA